MNPYPCQRSSVTLRGNHPWKIRGSFTQDVLGEVNWQAANEVLVLDMRECLERCRRHSDISMG